MTIYYCNIHVLYDVCANQQAIETDNWNKETINKDIRYFSHIIHSKHDGNQAILKPHQINICRYSNLEYSIKSAQFIFRVLRFKSNSFKVNVMQYMY